MRVRARDNLRIIGLEGKLKSRSDLTPHCPSSYVPCRVTPTSLTFGTTSCPAFQGPMGPCPLGRSSPTRPPSSLRLVSLASPLRAYSPVSTLLPLTLIRISHLSAPGAVHAAANPFTTAPGAHGPFLSPSTHIGKSQENFGLPSPCS